MTPMEAIALCRFAKACCPQQAFDEYTPDAWAELLKNVEFVDAKAAAVQVCRRQPFVSPAEIIGAVQQIHRVAMAKMQALEIPPMLDDAQEIEWRRRMRLLASSDRRENIHNLSREVVADMLGTTVAELTGGQA